MLLLLVLLSTGRKKKTHTQYIQVYIYCFLLFSHGEKYTRQQNKKHYIWSKSTIVCSWVCACVCVCMCVCVFVVVVVFVFFTPTTPFQTDLYPVPPTGERRQQALSRLKLLSYTLNACISASLLYTPVFVFLFQNGTTFRIFGRTLFFYSEDIFFYWDDIFFFNGTTFFFFIGTTFFFNGTTFFFIGMEGGRNNDTFSSSTAQQSAVELTPEHNPRPDLATHSSPSGHEHSYDPIVFMHCALSWHLHSASGSK